MYRLGLTEEDGDIWNNTFKFETLHKGKKCKNKHNCFRKKYLWSSDVDFFFIELVYTTETSFAAPS